LVQAEHLVLPDQRENKEIPEFMELQKRKARKDPQDHLVHLDLQGLWVLLDQEDYPEPRENMLQAEHLVLLDQKENMDLEDRQEHLVKMVFTESMYNLAHQDPKDQLE
jgi:hypothetical protein